MARFFYCLPKNYFCNMNKKSNKIAILGGGESGVGAALLAKAKGFDVFLSDKGSLHEPYRQILIDSQIEFEENQHTEARILVADEVIKSPGIPNKVPLIQKLLAQNTPIISEIEFACRYTKAKIIAITGSNGKTTTTLLTYHLLKHAGVNVGLGGNIGDSFAKQVLENDFDWYVLELSSFQLDNMYDFKADIAILLNITPDHLDRYDYDFQQYVNAKFRLLQNMTANDDFIYFAESPAIAQELSDKTFNVNYLPVSLDKIIEKGAFFLDGMLHVNNGSANFEIETKQLPIKGPHNAINAMAGILASLAVGIGADQIRDGLLTFENVEHRLEPVETVHGVQFINDSKATNVDSVFYALNSFDTPIILILGGTDKGNDYTQIEALVSQKVKALICLGADNRKLLSFFTPLVPVLIETQSAEQAVNEAYTLARVGDTVLLSPACASFDLFKNYQDRGQQFKAAVRQLKEKK
jgi:UDP-N-acetylmuramoylalanine--D-glutamate ligase